MEFALGRSGERGGVKEEKRSESNGGGGDGEGFPKEENAVKVQTTMPKVSTKNKEVDEVESAKAEMGEVREENQRLKMCLERVLKDYQTLQMQFQGIVQETKRPADKGNSSHEEPTEESELVSLSLGRVPSNPKNDEQTKKVSKQLIKDEKFAKNLDLGLDFKFETSNKSGGNTTEALPNTSHSNSSDNAPIKEDAGETWPPSRALKKKRESEEDEVSQQNPAQKARVCVRARCETLTMNDGCQWRKYGQKIAKGNPCPRAYYRCTIAPTCPVRKQVQRCAEDMAILITTYEGTHNHPLPLAATAMASTTSAAASMLLSGSSTSRAGSEMASTATTTTTTTAAADLHGLNFYLSDGSNPKFYISNHALSQSSSHPTLTIDLTNPVASSSSQFGRTIFASNYPSRYSSSSTSLNFNSSDSHNAISWNNGLLSYGTSTHPYNNRNFLSTINLGWQSSMENNIYMQKNSNTPNPAQRSLAADSTIAAATKVITSDPTFQSALTAALTSILGTGNGIMGGKQGTQNSVGENLGQKMKLGEIFPVPTSTLTLTSTSKVNGCASSFLNHRPLNAQTGSLMFLAPSSPYSSPKSATGSPGDIIESNNN